MKLFVLGSMKFSEKMVEAREALRQAGHEVVTSHFVDAFIGKSDEEKPNSYNASGLWTKQVLIPSIHGLPSREDAKRGLFLV